MAMKVIDNLPAFQKSLKALLSKRVLVGVPAQDAARAPEEGESAAPLTNAEIGYLMENGVPEKNIPARPHLMPGVEDAKDKIVATFKAGGEKILDGDTGAIDETLNKVGLIAQNAVRTKITNGPFQELAEATIENRKRRGRTGEKPLIDSGQYRAAITYVIRLNGKR
ncbi:MAG: hypothetical protein E6Q77_08605 [Rhizobium sp.]|nr:MAG: hypothetical protein E6Q77_08605 [Rhizobium sp.]